MEFIEELLAGSFSCTILSYAVYLWYFLYSLIPIFIHIIFLYFVQRKNILKVAIPIFLTQGIVIATAEWIYFAMRQIHNDLDTLGFWNSVLGKDSILCFSCALLLFIILIVINCIIYIDEITKENYKKFIFLMIGYLINVVVVVYMMIEYRLFLLT